MKITTNRIYSINSKFFTVLLIFGLAAFSLNSGTAQSTPASSGDQYSYDVQNIDVATFDALRKNKEYVKIDVRTPEQVKMNRLGGSLEIDFSSPSFASKLAELDKDQYYLVFCEDGSNGAKAVKKMNELGFKHVSNLEGGFASWMAADRPPE